MTTNAESVGFLGGGRIARILLGGWARAGALPQNIVVSDPDQQALARLTQIAPQIKVVAQDNNLAAGQDIVFLALHPPQIPDVLSQIKSVIRGDAVLVSLAPKLTIARLCSALGGFDRIARMIPNAPSLVGAGYNPIAYGPGLPTDERQKLARLLEPLGRCPEVEESKLEAFAVLTAMGPTYLWPQLYELHALAQKFGLSSSEAEDGLRDMVAGAVATMFESGLSSEEVQDLIPVKPLADLQDTILEAYRTKLTAIMEKIKP